MTNGAYGSRSHGGHGLDRYDTIRYGMLLDAPNRRDDGHRYYSSSRLDRHHDHHRYHPYQRSDRGYLSNEFKKEKPPTFDGEMKKSHDAKAWLLCMRMFFRLHEYSENMKAKIATFSLKGKVDIL